MEDKDKMYGDIKLQKFKQRQSLPLESKVSLTKRLIMAWYDHWDGDVYEAISMGKDSQVLGHIIKSMGGKYAKIRMVFSNTGLEMPEIVKHGRQHLNGELGWGIEEIRPRKTYDQVWREEGIPLVSKKVARQIRTLKTGPTGKGDTYRLYNEGITSQGHAAPRWKLANKWRHLVDNENIKTTEKCCDYLKKDPMKIFERDNDLKGKGMTAMMASEGGYRSSMFQCNVYEGKTTRSSPMLFWTESDIWEYIEKYDVQICHAYYNRMYDGDGTMVACDSKFTDVPSIREFEEPRMLNAIKWDDCQDKDFGSYAIYEDWKDSKKRYYKISGEKRTGCMFCAFGAHLEKGSNRFQRMSVSHPRQHKLIMDRIGMREPLELINVKVTFDE